MLSKLRDRGQKTVSLDLRLQPQKGDYGRFSQPLRMEFAAVIITILLITSERRSWLRK